MMLPGAIALISPILVGFIFGPEVLGGFLAGATVSGVLMGMFQNNAGGAWDNAKKSFEKGVDINGTVYYKGSEPHKASVTGDTVGDPFKDTSGPSMNILIKLMSIVSLVIAPTLAVMHADSILENRNNKLEALQLAATGSTAHGTQPTLAAAPVLDLAAPSGAMNENGDFVYFTGNQTNIQLPNGEVMTAGEMSQIAYLSRELNTGNPDLLTREKWFLVENIFFNSESSDLKPESEAAIQQLYQLLNAYPTMRIKIGGYTDNTGNESTNMKLSKLRAETVKLQMMELGIAADRMEAEGYGSANPLCEANDTDECKAMNRRIGVRILSL